MEDTSTAAQNPKKAGVAVEDSSTAAHTLKNGRRKPWKIRLPLLILHKDLEQSSCRVGSDEVITQDILENKRE